MAEQTCTSRTCGRPPGNGSRNRRAFIPRRPTVSGSSISGMPRAMRSTKTRGAVHFAATASRPPLTWDAGLGGPTPGISITMATLICTSPTATSRPLPRRPAALGRSPMRSQPLRIWEASSGGRLWQNLRTIPHRHWPMNTAGTHCTNSFGQITHGAGTRRTSCLPTTGTAPFPRSLPLSASTFWRMAAPSRSPISTGTAA